MKKVCPVCGKVFITKDKRQIRCSRSCLYKYLSTYKTGKLGIKKGRVISCLQCGRKVYRYPSWNTKFCSISCSSRFNNRGANNGRYIDGRSSIVEAIRGLPKSKEWRTSIYRQDNYTCECGKRGGDLHAHHVKPFNLIFKEFLSEYRQFSPIDDKDTLVRLATGYRPFWEAKGKTMCEDCHRKVTVYGCPA